MTSPSPRPLAIANWLFIIALMIFAMVIIGGITRLTESGLSITEWKPVTGAIPPLTDTDWQIAFDKYKNSSQYVLMNAGMTMAAFKYIFFWEYFHRLVARLLGLAFALPLIYFLATRAIPKGFTWRLILLFILGGAQGGIGWVMVASGLTNRVNVAPTLLAAHLSMALLLLAAVLWTALDMHRVGKGGRPAGVTPFTILIMLALFSQIFFGAIMAGLRAGHASNTWPLMNDRLYPDGIGWAGSYWLTLTSDPFLIHFVHRWWAIGVAVILILVARRVKAIGNRPASIALNSAVGLQVLLGIATILANVHIALAVTHQAVGAILVACTLWALHSLACPQESRA
ncbi:MAG: COX15/CtaA family protein [Sphingomonadaceae bacterium]